MPVMIDILLWNHDMKPEGFLPLMPHFLQISMNQCTSAPINSPSICTEGSSRSSIAYLTWMTLHLKSLSRFWFKGALAVLSEWDLSLTIRRIMVSSMLSCPFTCTSKRVWHIYIHFDEKKTFFVKILVTITTKQVTLWSLYKTTWNRCNFLFPATFYQCWISCSCNYFFILPTLLTNGSRLILTKIIPLTLN